VLHVKPIVKLVMDLEEVLKVKEIYVLQVLIVSMDNSVAQPSKDVFIKIHY
jgi:hypothetical protein